NITLNELIIFGQTNINEFELQFSNTNKNPENTYTVDQDEVVFDVPVKCITGDNYYIVRDFRKLVKAIEYPVIELILDKNEINSIVRATNIKSIRAKIKIAGIANSYSIPCSTIFGDNYNLLEGETKILLSDFKLKLQKRALGLIHTKNEVIVNFSIKFKN
ncbi:MAG: hypothetical protein PF541_14610, partial [Prolixibacteraceae bacterium]|nr:hypothetical protein [Prolixibacteraceae bacterium]